jgi:hypothetical protein
VCWHTYSLHSSSCLSNHSLWWLPHIFFINILYTGWWFQPLWKIWKSVEVNSQYMEKIKKMFQTTNQIYMRTKFFNDWITMSDSNISTLDGETTIALPWTRPPRPAGWISWHRTCRSPAN